MPIEKIQAGVNAGSSPRSRGTCRSAFSRIISHTVHPRARGEHIQRDNGIRWPAGSSPRSRGTSTSIFFFYHVNRFIPALAGNICCPGHRLSSAAVHPRARGEHHFLFNPVLNHGGSSPRSRGTLTCSFLLTLIFRFIPALAGNMITHCRKST